MKVKVLKDFKGSPDGRYAVQYYAGEEVELSDSLAEVALAEGWAKQIAETAAPEDKKKTGKGGAKTSSRASGSEE